MFNTNSTESKKKNDKNSEDEIESENDGENVNDVDVNEIDGSYKPTLEEKEALKLLKIKLRHTPPDQHKIEKTAGTRSLSKADRQKFESYISLKTGTFSPEEDEIIKKNWKKFCKLHEWDRKNPKPFLFMKHKNKEFLMSQNNRMKFVQFLANKLNDRSLYSVYHRFRNIYEPHKTSRYKPEEDEIILKYVKNYESDKDRKFADLAVILQRTRASVWRRYRVLQKKNPKRTKK